MSVVFLILEMIFIKYFQKAMNSIRNENDRSFYIFLNYRIFKNAIEEIT